MSSNFSLFLKESIRSHRGIGAISPSSPALAGALTRHLRAGRRPRRILEAGPGTGAVTRRIQRLLGDDETLDVVESNPRFAAGLERRFTGDARITVYNAPVEEHRLGTYDAIVCGIPFANLDAGTVRRIFSHLLFAALRPAGTMSFFNYVGGSTVHRVLGFGMPHEPTDIVARVVNMYRFQAETIVLNVPPARVHHLTNVRRSVTRDREFPYVATDIRRSAGVQSMPPAGRR